MTRDDADGEQRGRDGDPVLFRTIAGLAALMVSLLLLVEGLNRGRPLVTVISLVVIVATSVELVRLLIRVLRKGGSGEP